MTSHARAFPHAPLRPAGTWTNISLPPLALVALYALVWASFATLANDAALHPDMTEAYSWGQEFQFGYYKHPPFWAWLAGAWFTLLPRTHFAFYSLAALNSGIGLLGIYRTSQFFTDSSYRISATLLILATPLYTFLGLRYNANAIQLSLWPWTAYFFLNSMDRRTTASGLLFGVLAAAGLLSKYSFLINVASCFVASLAHCERRAYYRSPAPYAAMLACCLLFAPHLVWLFKNDFMPLTYLDTKTSDSAVILFRNLADYVLAGVAFHLALFPLILFAKWHNRQLPQANRDEPRLSNIPVLWVLALGPLVFSIIAAIIFHIKMTSNYEIPIYAFVPLLLLHIMKPPAEPMRRIAIGTAVAISLGSLCLAPIAPYLVHALHGFSAQSSALEVVHEADRLWHERTGRPLAFVAGLRPFATDLTFYSKDRPSEFMDFDLRHAPWIDLDRLRTNGFLAICLGGDNGCRDRLLPYANAQMIVLPVTVTHTIRGLPADRRQFDIYVVPPKPSAAAASQSWLHPSFATTWKDE